MLSYVSWSRAMTLAQVMQDKPSTTHGEVHASFDIYVKIILVQIASPSRFFVLGRPRLRNEVNAVER